MANNEDKEAVKRQHAKGKLTARERINILMDKNSFTELNSLVELKSSNYNLQEKKKAGDGVITGYGKINGKPVCIYVQDFTFMGGSMGEMHNLKIASIMEHALKTGCPIIGLFDSGGARIQEGIHGLDTGGLIFKNNTLASGVIPQISVILGPCAGIAVYSPALTDFILIVDGIGHMFIIGPRVIKSVTGEDISYEELGGAKVHCQVTGVADLRNNSEQ